MRRAGTKLSGKVGVGGLSDEGVHELGILRKQAGVGENETWSVVGDVRDELIRGQLC